MGAFLVDGVEFVRHFWIRFSRAEALGDLELGMARVEAASASDRLPALVFLLPMGITVDRLSSWRERVRHEYWCVWTKGRTASCYHDGNRYDSGWRTGVPVQI